MNQPEYMSITVNIVNKAIVELVRSKCLDPHQTEPLKDALLTAIDWHCAPLIKR